MAIIPLTGIEMVHINALEAQKKSEITRKVNALNRLRMLKDDYDDQARHILKNYVSEKTYKRLEKIINTTINVYKAVIQEISILYAEDPQRTFESETNADNKEQIEYCEQLYERINI